MNNLSLTTDKVIVTLNMVESDLWKKSKTYQKEVKQLASVMSDEASQFEIRDTYGVLLYTQQITH